MDLTAAACRSVAEAAWTWVLAQVRWDDGPWVPTSVPPPAAAPDPPAGPPGPPAPDPAPDPAPNPPPWDRDGTHSGIGGLAHLLAEIRLTRSWTAEERDLAEAVAARLIDRVAVETDVTFFDGLAGTVGVLVALGGDDLGRTAVDTRVALDRVVDRLLGLAGADGWPQTAIGAPRYAAGARVNDLTLGTAGVLTAAVWARRHGAAGAGALAGRAADILLAEAEQRPTGLDWRFVPERFHVDTSGEMPNLSHGLAGIAAGLAAAGLELGRPDLVDAARLGAEHLVTLADLADDGFIVPRTVPHTNPDLDEVTFTWCHGPTGTASLFLALDRAGVTTVAGAAPLDWHRRCLHSVRTSGVPARLHPGFWDNDGRCCGTAGVGDVFLDSWHRTGEPDDLVFVAELADTLLERAVRDGPYAYWRFVEHRAEDPLLPPGVGWMQGAAGIAAFLFRAGRVLADPAGAAAVPRMDTWWAGPDDERGVRAHLGG